MGTSIVLALTTGRKPMAIKYFVSGVAMAACLAVAGPVWAQNPATPGAAGAGVYSPPAEPAPNSAAPPEHHMVHHARVMHAHHMHMASKAAAAGDTTAQLNREELARIQSGNVTNPPAPPAPPMPGH
jgi:hypothetical protein